MAAYIDHIRALAQRIHESDALPLRWHQDDPDEGLHYFLAQKMEVAGLLDAERSSTSIAVHGLTAQGQQLVAAPNRLSPEFLDGLREALYKDTL